MASNTAPTQDKVKRRYLEEWAQAVNAHAGFGRWLCAVAKKPGEIRDILIKTDSADLDGAINVGKNGGKK